MQIIDLNAPVPANTLPRTTVMSYGPTRSGKTRFAGSWPRPLFLSDATESGWTTLRSMDDAALWESGMRPKVWGIETAADMMKAIGDAAPLVAQKKVQTIVVDSLTYYADLYFANLMRMMGGKPDPRRAYGDLNNHLRDIRIRIHSLPVNVIWLALDKPPSEESPVGGPLIPGQQQIKFAAGCDYILFHREVKEAQGQSRYEIRTRRYGAYPAGGRDEGRVPDPLNETTFREFAFHAFGYDESKIAKPAAPTIVRAATTAPVPARRVTTR